MSLKLWSWGANNTGQLGHGYCSEQVSLPTEMTCLDSWSLTTTEDCSDSDSPQLLQISGGGSHTTIFDGRSDKVYKFHTLGLISTKFECPKEQILTKTQETRTTMSLSKSGEEVLCSGWDFTLFLNSIGELYSLGDNTYAQLGRQVLVPLHSLNGIRTQFSPSWAKVPVPVKIGFISAGMRHVAIISKENSSLYTWGDNSKGQTGLNLDFKVIPEPTLVTDLNFIPIQVKCSKTATIVLDQNGTFYGAGLNKFGILGEHQTSRGLVPSFVKIFSLKDIGESGGEKVKEFQCGWNHVLVLLENGKVISWGRNNFHQLGRSSRNHGAQYDPTPGFVELPEPIVSISCGSEHNLMLGSSGQVFSWGWNEHDNCGVTITHQEVIDIPTKVPLPEEDSAVLIGCGGGNSFVITTRRNCRNDVCCESASQSSS